MIEWLKEYAVPHDMDEGEYVYVGQFEKYFKVIPLKGDGILLINKHDDPRSSWIYFSVLYCEYEEYNSENETDKHYRCIFHGEGPTFPLGECRHTYWGEEGYIFYLNAETIKDSLDKLSEYFNFR